MSAEKKLNFSNYKIITEEFKQIHKKCVNLLYFLFVKMLIVNFYIKHIEFLIFIEILLFFSLILVIQSMKDNSRLKSLLFEGLNKEFLEKIQNFLMKKIKFLNLSLSLLQGSMFLILVDFLIKRFL